MANTGKGHPFSTTPHSPKGKTLVFIDLPNDPNVCFYASAYMDSDTGTGEDPKAHKARKTRRKRTTNLGPRLKVLNINKIESGLKVECEMETAMKKTITFEFSTVDFVPEDISNEFVKKDLLPPQHRDILIGNISNF